MFIHNLKYTVKILFKNKVLIFWMFAFPIILGIFFHMAFENIEKDEALQVFDIAVIDNKEYQNQTIYQETFKELSDKKNKNQLFHIHYVNKKEANQLLEDNEIEGYVLFNKQEPQIVIKENGMEQTILQFVMDEIKQNKRMIEDLTKKQIEDEIQQGNYNFNVQQIVHDILQKLNNQEVSLKDTSSSHLSYMQIEYYTLIAMACMYGGMLGLTAINNQLANMSAKGKRVSVSPNKKGILVLSSALGSYLVSLVGLAILLIFLKFGLNVEFGSQWFYIIILSLVGDLAGISMGIFIASVFRVSEQADEDAISYYVSSDVSNEVISVLDKEVYSKVLCQQSAIEKINSDKVLKAQLFNILERLKKIKSNIIQENAYMSFLKMLYYFNTATTRKYGELYDLVEKAIIQWCGNEDQDNICFDSCHEGIALYEHIEFEPYLDDSLRIKKNEELQSFLPFITVKYESKKTEEIISLDIDYSLYELIYKLAAGYIQTAEDRNNHADFISFIYKILRTGSADKEVFLVTDDNRKAIIEKTKFGVYKFKVVR